MVLPPNEQHCLSEGVLALTAFWFKIKFKMFSILTFLANILAKSGVRGSWIRVLIKQIREISG